MKKLTIDRQRWVRGRNKSYGNSGLLNEKGRMCCLGFWCHFTNGIPKSDLIDFNNSLKEGGVLYAPDEINSQLYRSWHNEAIEINDAPRMWGKKREERLINLFWEKAGIELEFIN